MPKSAITLARTLLRKPAGGVEDLRLHDFSDDEEAHDDYATESLYAEFSAEFDAVQASLIAEYGTPFRTGKTDNKIIPLNGVFRFAAWRVGKRVLYAAAAHEDRGLPILLVLGATDAV